MLAMKWLLMAVGVAMFGTAAGVVAYDVYLAMQFQKLMGSGELGAVDEAGASRPIRWNLAVLRFSWVWAALLLALAISMLPAGRAKAGMERISIARLRTLHPGPDLIEPLVQREAVHERLEGLLTARNEANASAGIQVQVMNAEWRGADARLSPNRD